MNRKKDNGQISMFESRDGTKPGDRTKDRARIGRKLTWEEACARIGLPVWYCTIMQSMTYWTAVIPECRMKKAMTFYRNGVPFKSDRLICFDGGKQRLLIDEAYCTGKYVYPEGAAFFDMKESS